MHTYPTRLSTHMAHTCAHAHTQYAHVYTLSTHVCTPNTRVHTAHAQHKHVTRSAHVHILYTGSAHIHALSTHITRAYSYHTLMCTHAQHTRVHTQHLSAHSHTCTHIHAHAQYMSDAVPPYITQLQRSVQDVSDSDSFHCQMEIHACISTPGASRTLKTP